MNKPVIVIFATATIALNINSAISAPIETGMLNSQHMKQFNIFERDPKTPQFLLNFQAEKNYTVNNIIFDKNEAFPNAVLEEIIPFKPGSRLSESELINMKNDLSQFYYYNGYKSAIVNFSTPKELTGTVLFSIYEGPKEKFKEEDSEKLID